MAKALISKGLSTRARSRSVSARGARIVCAALLSASLLSGTAGCGGDGATAPESSFTVVVVEGNLQRAPAGSVLPVSLSVLVKDASGVPVKGARVLFRVVRGASTGSRMLDSVAVTDPSGAAAARLQLGSALDTTLVAAFPAPASNRAVTFVAVGSAASTISSLSPTSFGAGDTVTLRGTGLAFVAPSGGVEFNGIRVAPLSGVSDTEVRAVAPACLAAGPLELRLATELARSNGLTATYQSRTAPLALVPFQALTVKSARLADCLVLAGDGAAYLVVAQFAGIGSAEATVDWRLSANLLPTAGTVGASVPAAGDKLTSQRELDGFLRRNEIQIAPRARAEAAADRGSTAYLQQTAAVPPALGSTRAFKVVAALDGTSFTSVSARLRFAGSHLLLYTDTSGTGFSDAQYQALGALFDRDLYSVGVAAFGSESDVDRDGRITVLFTPVLNALVRARDCGQKGFVTGFFYATDLLLQDPNSNRAEIFYSFIPDPDGRFSCPHTTADVLRFLLPTFLHEQQHMISFNQHVLARGGQPEEVWLNEGLGHVAEEIGSKFYERKFPPPSGRGTAAQLFPDSAAPFIAPQLLNAYVFMNNTRAHSVTSYRGAGSIEERGATWLFLRWLSAQKGDDIFRRLVQTSKVGIANVEAEAAEPFGALFGDFSVSLFADSLPGVERSRIPRRFQAGSLSVRQLIARAAVVSGFTDPFPLSLYELRRGGLLQSAMLPGTMTHTLLQSALGSASVSLRFTRQDLSPFLEQTAAQVTIFRLPP